MEAAEPWYLEALRTARESDDSWSILDNLNCLGDGYLGLGQIRPAKERFTEGLRLAMDLGRRMGIAPVRAPRPRFQGAILHELPAGDSPVSGPFVGSQATPRRQAGRGRCRRGGGGSG